MTRSVNTQLVSPLISGGIFSQRDKRSGAQHKLKKEPKSIEIIKDFGELLADLMIALTEVVDRAFPNADFLHRDQVSGSKIEKDTKLSFVIRTSFGLSQMSLRSEIIENYQQTLKKYLDNIQHHPRKKGEYTQLLNIIKTYQSLSSAMTSQQQIRDELNRLHNTLDLAPKTIDRRLQLEWVEPCIQKPTAELTAQVAKTMRLSENLQSIKLAGRNNSLAGLSRLVSTSDKGLYKQKLEDHKNQTQNHQTIVASAT